MRLYQKGLKMALFSLIAMSIAGCSSGQKTPEVNKYSAFISPGDAQYYRSTIDVSEEAGKKRATLTTKNVEPAVPNINGDVRDIYIRAIVDGKTGKIQYQIVNTVVSKNDWADFKTASYGYAKNEDKGDVERIHKEYVCAEGQPCTYHEKFVMDISIKEIASYIAYTDKVLWVPFSVTYEPKSSKPVTLDLFDSEFKGLIFMANDMLQHYNQLKEKPVEAPWLK